MKGLLWPHREQLVIIRADHAKDTGLEEEDVVIRIGARPAAFRLIATALIKLTIAIYIQRTRRTRKD